MIKISTKIELFLTSKHITNFLYLPQRTKKGIDYSLLPKIYEKDIEEKFVRGSGPGGSAVNKNSNCAVITHKPSGIVIKCHQSRSLDDNRKIARQMLISKLDDIQNGNQSVNQQIKALEEKKSNVSYHKKGKLDALKSAWKIREGID
ncbi:mitochondrial translation release factor in rescue [Arctopsyche grandis]|uniref:mitochondrial translation release factor in rescue n=1 Tax=Arctopsyche grandis TaxID=121162 RepID=UPI00406D819C